MPGDKNLFYPLQAAQMDYFQFQGDLRQLYKIHINLNNDDFLILLLKILPAGNWSWMTYWNTHLLIQNRNKILKHLLDIFLDPWETLRHIPHLYRSPLLNNSLRQ